MRGIETMMTAMCKTDRQASIWSRLAAFRRDNKGIAAIEFAFIAPILITLYFMTMEIAQGIETNKKIGRIASMVGDLVTQQQIITKSELDAILDLGESVIQPYTRSVPKIEITAIEITDETTPKVKVVWSRKLVAGSKSAGAAAGSITTVPEKLKIKGTFLVRVESDLDYKPMIVWTAAAKTELGLGGTFDALAMEESYHLRPRMSPTIACSDC